jgi:hypothetical protein
VLHLDVEITVVVKDARIDELVLHFMRRPGPVDGKAGLSSSDMLSIIAPNYGAWKAGVRRECDIGPFRQNRGDTGLNSTLSRRFSRATEGYRYSEALMPRSVRMNRI